MSSLSCAARLPGYSLHLLDSAAFLPRLPAPLQYRSVQGGIVAVLQGSASAAAQVPFQPTVLGVSPAYGAQASAPALAPVLPAIQPAPANFTPPAINGFNASEYYSECHPMHDLYEVGMLPYELAGICLQSSQREFGKSGISCLRIVCQQETALELPPVSALWSQRYSCSN